MQKTVIKALLFHYTPTTVIIAGSADGTLQQTMEIPHATTSRDLIPTIDTLLSTLQWPLESLSYLGCAQGPGSFTTLRSLIVTVNGIGFATQIPLMGFNTLTTLAQSTAQLNYTVTYALADAYCHNVHSARYEHDSTIISIQTITYDAWITHILLYVAQFPHHTILVVGSGLTPRTHTLTLPMLPTITYRPDITHAPVDWVSTMLYQRWLRQEQLALQLLPFYGKIDLFRN